MNGDPRDYDKAYAAPQGGPVRQRVGIDLERGRVTRFVVQLEYLIDPQTDEWAVVVRYDHDAEGSAEATHDVTEEGLHIDIYRDGEKIDSQARLWNSPGGRWSIPLTTPGTTRTRRCTLKIR